MPPGSIWRRAGSTGEGFVHSSIASNRRDGVYLSHLVAEALEFCCIAKNTYILLRESPHEDRSAGGHEPWSASARGCPTCSTVGHPHVAAASPRHLARSFFWLARI